MSLTKHVPQVGPRYQHRNTEFWAEDGMICWEDRNTGEFFAFSQREARERFWNIGRMWIKADRWSVNDTRFKDLRPDIRNLLLDMESVLREAHNQGDPTAKIVEERKERAELRSAILAPAGGHVMPAHAMPGVYNGSRLPQSLPMDRRAKVSRSGKIWLPCGLGKRDERKYY